MAWWKYFFPKPSPNRFAKSIAGRIRRDPRVASVEIDESAFQLHITDKAGKTSHSSLSNLYLEVTSLPPWRRGEAMDRMMRAFEWGDRKPVSREEFRARLLPSVKDALYFDEALAMAGGKDMREVVVHRPMSAGLIQVLVADEPDRISTVSKENLAEHGLTADEAFTIARENLWKRSTEEFSEVRPGLYIGPWGDNQASSRLVLHDLIWQLKVSGDHVAMIPNRDTLLITGLDNTEGLRAMGAIATETLRAEPRPFTGYLYRLDKSTWAQHTLESNHPAYACMHDALVVGHAIMYEGQKARFEKAFQAAGQDVFVAKFSVLQDNTTKALSSYCVWSPIPSSLPEVDQVHLFEQNASGPSRAARVDWAQAMTHFQAFMKLVPDSTPPRWMVDKHPPDEAVKAAGGEWHDV